ncbi:hypothetical protein Tco_0056744, partial [Tanacetum coccineum]
MASNKRIVYTTTRPNDIKTPFEEMLENDVEFGAPDKRSDGFLNSALVGEETGRQDSELLLRNVASKKRIVYMTTRPNIIKMPFEKMLENDVEFGAPDKRFDGFLNFAL